MLEELRNRDRALRVYSLTPLSILFLCFIITVEEVISQVPAPITMSDSYIILPYHETKLTPKNSHNKYPVKFC